MEALERFCFLLLLFAVWVCAQLSLYLFAYPFVSLLCRRSPQHLAAPNREAPASADAPTGGSNDAAAAAAAVVAASAPPARSSARLLLLLLLLLLQ